MHARSHGPANGLVKNLTRGVWGRRFVASAAALAPYRDTLGFEEAWREGELTAGLVLPGTDVQSMLDQDVPEGDKPGPFFQVDDVDVFYAQHQGELPSVAPPKNIPPGRYVAFDDPWGNRVHVLDLSSGG